MSGGLAFPSDSSDFPSDEGDIEEYDEEAMAGPEALLFKHFGVLWPGTVFDGARHKGATREMCPICSGAGWLWVLPTPPKPPSSRKS